MQAHKCVKLDRRWAQCRLLGRICHRATGAPHARLAVQTGAAPLLQGDWGLWATLASCAAVAQASTSTRIGRSLSPPLVAMAQGITLTAAGVLPQDCASFDVVWKYLMPLAAACFLLESDLTRVASDGGPTLIAFLVGAVTMVVGALVAWAAVGPWMAGSRADSVRLAACLCASYVGGSVNFAAVASAVALPAGLVPGAMAADNIAMAAFLAALAAVPVPSQAGDPTVERFPSPSRTASSTVTPSVTATSLACALGTACAACAISQACAAALGLPSLHLLLMAVTAAVLAAGVRAMAGQRGTFSGASQLGAALMALFFVVIGCNAGSLGSLANRQALGMLGFLGLMVGVHWALLWAANAAVLRLPLPAVLLGSNAAVGGPATAAAMAASRPGWAPLLQPAMLSGSLGYALGTLAGLAVARVLGTG